MPALRTLPFGSSSRTLIGGSPTSVGDASTTTITTTDASPSPSARASNRPPPLPRFEPEEVTAEEGWGEIEPEAEAPKEAEREEGLITQTMGTVKQPAPPASDSGRGSADPGAAAREEQTAVTPPPTFAAPTGSRPRTPGGYSMTMPAERRSSRPGPENVERIAQVAVVPATSVAAPSKSERTLEAELTARSDRLKADDPVGAARAQIELGLLAEWERFDRDEARKHYEAARSLVRALQPALTRLRRLMTQKPEKGEALPILDDELGLAETDELKADLHATRARTQEALGQLDAARASYLEALRWNRSHPASLRGLESLLRREVAAGKAGLARDLAEHLARLAETYAQPGAADFDSALGAWIHVERAEILDQALKEADQARAALEKGVALEPNPGPVRSAFLRHLARFDKDGLAEGLRLESDREGDNARAARLLYTAARITIDRSQSHKDAVQLLLAADGRAPQGSPTQARILDELANALETDGNFAKIVEVRHKRLSLLTKNEQIAWEYVRLSDAYARLGRPDVAADMAARALHHDPTNEATREKLDQTLMRLGRHADRVRSWIVDANTDRPLAARISAFRRAADIAVRHLNQRDQGIETLRAAWLLEPGNGGVFDDLSALVRAPSVTGEAEMSKIHARVDLYVQAAALEKDQDRKIGLLEKMLSIYEDELGDPKRAIEVVDQILALEPGRRSAILALSRNARRANDTERLARALAEEAKITQDAGLKCRLWLEAGEVSDRLGDRERALSLLDRALAAKPFDPATLRARVRILGRMSRHDEARKALLSLVSHQPDQAFELWLEIAEQDETVRRSPLDAVEAYRAAARLRPSHPLPRIAMLRLLRGAKEFKKLCEALEELAKNETDPGILMHLWYARAEVEELCLENDAAALESLERADELARDALAEQEVPYDPAVLEATERILVRQTTPKASGGSSAGDGTESLGALTRLYAKWLERKPPAALDHRLRISLASALARTSPSQAIEVLEALVGVVPGHVPALRMLEHLQRERGAHAALSTTLYAESSVFTSRPARVGALWELVAMEERVGPSTTLDALSRITHEYPHDYAALDTVMRVASKLVSGVGVPHPALLAARSQLLASLHARRDLSVDPLAKAAFYLEEAMLCERAETDPEVRVALDAFRDALGLWPDSLVAARGLERLATKLGDAKGIIKSQLALAKLLDHPVTQAAHLVRAAELTASHLRDERQALELYESALASDPENRAAAHALATMLKGDPRRLVERLRPALDRARAREQVALLGSQIAIATLDLGEAQEAPPDYGPAILAMNRVLAVVPDDVGSLFLLARLLKAQKAWGEARDTLNKIIQLSSDPKARVAAYFGLVEIYEGPLGDLELAETALTSVLGLDSKNKSALERLYQLALKKKDTALVRSALERLAEQETDLSARTEYQMRLSDVCRDAGDSAAMVRALSDAIVSAPSDMRPWTQLARAFRTESPDGAAPFGRAVEQVIEIAKARRRPIEPRWLMTLGLLEVNVLKRASEGVAHLQAAAQLGNIPEMRAAVGQGLLATGRNKEAVVVLRELLTADSDSLVRLAEPSAFTQVRGGSVASTGTVLSATLSCLDAALGTDGRTEERLAVEEVRGCLGELPADRIAALRARRLEPEVPYANAYAGSEIGRALLPEARTPVIDAALAIAPIAAKSLRFEVSSLGVGSRERIGPRDGHPTRIIADKLARALGIPEFELYLTPSWQGAMRVYPGDPPALVGHVSFAELSEPEQVFALGRLLTRIAVGMAWLDEIPLEAGDGLLLAAMRCVLPQFGAGEIAPAREHHAQSLSPGVQRAIGRKQRRLLEDLAPNMAATYDFRTISIAVRRSEYRTAYVLGGNLVGAIDYLRLFDSDIARSAENPRLLLQHPVTNELIRFALSPESYAERRRIGTVWTTT